ncbi:MAG: hypothetical protein ABSH38_02315 [Verrucomicrobiota bacterium]|jgi:hypothetical protein
MNRPVAFLGLLTLVGATVTDLYGQLVVDAGGPRDSFYSSASSTLGLSGLAVKLNTDPESLEATYLSGTLFGKQPLPEGSGNWLYGLDVKFSAVNGVLNMNSWPKTDLSPLLNHTWITSSTDNKPWIFSLNLRDTPSFAQYPIFDKTLASGKQFYTKNALGNTVVGTFSVVPGGASWFALAVSAGFSATNNYAQLPKVTVGKLLASGSSTTVVGSGQAARYGTFERYNAVPLTLMTVFQPVEGQWTTNFSKCAGTLLGWLSPGAKDASYIPIVSPYASLTPGDLGRPVDAVGLNLVIRGMDSKVPVDSTGPHPEAQKLSFPLSIFVERVNAFSGKPSITVGAGLTFKWP